MDICKQWFIYGKDNVKTPEGYDSENLNQIMYDEDESYGFEIKGGIRNGYNEKELLDFWENIEGFAEYLSK